MSTAEPEGQSIRPAQETTTLGEILYRDKNKARVSEEEWVDLVRAIAAGDQSALHSIYTQMHRIVFTLILRITANRETAEELTIDVFHDVWRRAATYDPGNGSVTGWIMNQARCRAIDRLRFDQRKKRVNQNSHALSVANDIVDPQQAALFKEQTDLLKDALQVLSPLERQAIESAFFGEMSYAEVALKLSQPVGTVKTRIRSGLNKLRAALAQR